MGGMTDFLLELRSEEIPARMQDKAREDLARLFTEELAKAGLKADGITTYATPRRLALIARNLPLETEAVNEERKGPRADAPEQALAGFLRSTGLTRDQLVERDVKGQATLFAIIEKPGRKTADVLAEAIPAIIRAFPWPKSMRWGKASLTTESLRWVRPLQGIVALLGDEVVHCAVDGIESGAATMGHRFHAPGEITIGNADDYAVKLRAVHVIVDQEERRSIIRTGAEKAAQDAGLILVSDEGLVSENAGLTEWPVPLLGRFDPAFLEVPEEVIQLTARVNQKYFVCHDKGGKLANAFVCTANIDARDGGEAIIAGNEKVLAARLSDAKFFWEQDLKIPLEKQAEKLGQIVFHEKLGAVADKVDRVAKLARWFAEEGVVKGANPDDAEKAARLCKADLVTGMVGEFPELQGVMGGYYARAQGHGDAVADAVRDHYKPVGQGDDVPAAPVTVAVSLADKLDTLLSFFKIELFPTGSKDPFALRRAGLGYLRLIQQNGIKLHLESAALQWGELGDATVGIVLADFLFERLAVQLKEFGVRHDFIEASRNWTQGSDIDGRVDRVQARAEALATFLATDAGANLLSGYKRAANILKQQGDDNIAPAGVIDGFSQQEQSLLTALEKAEPQADAALQAEDFGAAMAALASLRAPIDAFFDAVMVNDPDPEKRAFRLGLLTRFRNAVDQVADFSKIEG